MVGVMYSSTQATGDSALEDLVLAEKLILQQVSKTDQGILLSGFTDDRFSAADDL
jgi:hypothetical protein